MPLSYEGTLAEHRDVRTGCGVFDVSHLGRFEVSGTGALDLVSRLLCNNPTRIGPGRAQYTMMLTLQGGVVDDIILWWLEDERFIVLPNGTNHDAVIGVFVEAAATDVTITDLRDESALLAIQGPQAPRVIESVLGMTPGRFRLIDSLGPTGSVTAAGTGYTGEPGAEIMVTADAGDDMLEAFLEAGAAPCGLGARDTLRLEMGYPLWGQELDRTTSPLEADLEWVVGWDHEFVGREALVAQRDTGQFRKLVGFRFPGRTIPRHGHPLRCGASSGAVTSGNFSPTLEAGIGLGYLTPVPDIDDGIVEVEIRGEWHAAALVEPPFVER